MAAAATAAVAPPATSAQQKPPEAGKVPGVLPGGQLKREMQVKYVLQLLRTKGEVHARTIEQRLSSGRGVTIKGFQFDNSALEEALSTWRAGEAAASARTPKEAAPPNLAGTSPGMGTPPAPVLPTAKRRLSAGGSGGGAVPSQPSARKRSFSSGPDPDENLDPQTSFAAGRAAKEKAERVSTSPGGVPSRQPNAAAGAFDGGGPPPCPAAASKPPAKRLRRESSGGDASRPAPSRAPAERAPADWASSSPPAAASRVAKSVKELKQLLSESGLDCSGCVEKADLQALWDRFEHFRGQPLEELREECAASGGPHFGSLDECARFLAAPPTAGSGQGTTAAPAAAPPAPAHAPEPAVDEVGTEAADRERDAEREVQRIQALRRERYPTKVAWGFAVLDVTVRDVASVQRGYRALMRKLHPDKVGRSAEVTRAVELIREAKELCERGLSKEQPPSVPRCLKFSPMCSEPGKRKFRLHWQAPEERASAPVRRYIVAAMDPAYGRALTITVLEPDYSEELRRFVGVEELTSYVFAEEDLQKMPRLWEKAYASVQVAAANEAGQSPWAMLQLPLLPPSSLPAPDLASVLRGPTWGAAWGAAGPPSSWAPPSAGGGSDDPEAFDRELRRKRGSELRDWLNKQRKPLLVTWLKNNSWPNLGTKEELADRIEQAIAMASKLGQRRGGIRGGIGKL